MRIQSINYTTHKLYFARTKSDDEQNTVQLHLIQTRYDNFVYAISVPWSNETNREYKISFWTKR